MFNRLFLHNNIKLRRYAANSSRHLQLQTELGIALRNLRKISDKEIYLKQTRELIQKYGEEHDHDLLLLKQKVQPANTVIYEHINLEKKLSLDKVLSILNDIRRECAEGPIVTPAFTMKK